MISDSRIGLERHKQLGEPISVTLLSDNPKEITRQLNSSTKKTQFNLHELMDDDD